MTEYRARLGFISANSRWGSHYDRFLALVPKGVSVDINPLGLWQRSLDDLKDAADTHLARTLELVERNHWDALAIMGAPIQVENPGLIERIRAGAGVPVTSALESGAAALKAFGVRRAVLLTPFDQRRNGLIVDFLQGVGIEAVLPKEPAQREDTALTPQSAERFTPDDVHEMAVRAFREAGGAEGIYFQGAPLDPLLVWERLEQELGVPVVTSNPAMLWHTLSLLGLRHQLEQGGRLLREWPMPESA